MKSKHLTYPHPLYYSAGRPATGKFYMRTITLHITGMSCGHCLHAVSDALTSKPGVQLESLRMGQAVVSYDEKTTDPAAIESLVGDAGYTATAAPSGVGGAEERV